MSKPAEYRSMGFTPTLWNRIEAAAKARAGQGEPPILLHIGDTWFDLPGELFEPLPEEPWARKLSKYGDTQGEIELRRRLARKLRDRNALPIDGPEQIQISYGGTGGLYIAMRRLLAPGSEVLTLAPYWPILKNVAANAGVRLVEVPFFDRVTKDAANDDVEALLAAKLTANTSGIYFNSPNNPSGVLLRRGHLEQLARFAREHDLWVLSDEAYEDFVWSDEKYVSIGSLPAAFERTVSVFTASKSYAAAGLRVGCVVAPTGVIAALNPTNVATGYEPSRPAQVQWIRGLERRDAIVSRVREAYRAGLDAVQRNLRIPYLKPEGSFYVFLDLRDRWAGLGEGEKMDRMLRAGVVVAPGEAFGVEYNGWARFCYTALPPEEMASAAARANEL